MFFCEGTPQVLCHIHVTLTIAPAGKHQEIRALITVFLLRALWTIYYLKVVTGELKAGEKPER